MASLIETLIDVLDQENTEYEKLLDLSRQKTTAIVEGDVDSLQKYLVKEQKFITDIDKLDKDREQNVFDICDVLNLSPKNIKIDSIIKLLEKQPEMQKKLNDVNVRLKNTLAQLMKINENNKTLLKESMDMIEFDLNLAKNALVSPHTANYGKGAYEEQDHTSTIGRFDAKQ